MLQIKQEILRRKRNYKRSYHLLLCQSFIKVYQCWGEVSEQAQICAEGCEEEYITHIFQIQLKHNLSALNKIRQMEFNSDKQG